ncbi:MAG: helix-turn-helix domain-containing protein [Nitrospinae bacterium]|nr:helix-turn-helix domain-containing protein [Nitrospinota bacterium]MBI3815174.1 helix-turn-helix domain-containing protein [Nitrospinota bacterium]
MKINKLKKDLGWRILDLRKAGGLTHEDLGEKSGLNYKFIGELERGWVNVSLDSLTKIVEVLGVKIGDLFSKDKIPVQKVFVKVLTEKRDFLSRFSPQEIQLIKKALRILNKTFSKV